MTVAATRERKVVPTQHIGDIDSPATAAFHREATDRLLSLLDVEPEVVACDMHPDLETTRLAQARPERTVRVQHHHAHAASLLAEHDCDRGVVIAADGTGYGPDGVVRGGEVLDATLTDCTRVGGLDEFPLAGGEQAVREPTRIAAALLAETEPERAAELLLERGTVDSRSIAEAVVGGRLFGEQAPPTSSAGRFLDAVAALLGVCTERRYQAEPAMRLEAVAAEGNPKQTDPPVIERAGEYVLDTERAFTALVALTGTHATPTVAATAQRLVGVGLADAALAAAADRNVETVGFTGGVAYNPAIDRYIRRRVEAAGYTYLGHDRVPPGDAGLAYGQAVVTSARLAESD